MECARCPLKDDCLSNWATLPTWASSSRERRAYSEPLKDCCLHLGHVTVTPALHFEVSRRIKDLWAPRAHAKSKCGAPAAVMQCVEEGKLDLDAPAKTYVPDIGQLKVLEGFDASGNP
jgi:hypothetical protein